VTPVRSATSPIWRVGSSDMWNRPEYRSALTPTSRLGWGIGRSARLNVFDHKFTTVVAKRVGIDLRASIVALGIANRGGIQMTFCEGIILGLVFYVLASGGSAGVSKGISSWEL
jgi:hypothetical protein